MTQSDIGTITIVYAVCLLFLYLTLQLKPAAQIYPLALIGGLFLLNTLYLVLRWLRMRKNNEKTVQKDFKEIFKNFQASQFFVVLGASIVYIILLFYIGFYLSSLLYLIGMMLYLKVKTLHLVLAVIILMALIYGVFTLFLNVPLPTGFLFS